jgi:hypothetical protein
MRSPVQDSAAAMAGKNGHSLISAEKFRQLFHALIASHLLNEHLRSAGKPAPAAHREAGPAGLVLDLRAEDTVFLPSPMHFAHHVKGSALKPLLTEPTAASTTSLGRRLTEAIASALNNRIEKSGGIVLVLFDLAANSGDSLSSYDEVFATAVAAKLPILFVLESPAGFTDSLAFKAAHPTLPYIAVDAHDIVAVYRVAQESIARTREGGGPALIELALCDDTIDDPIDKMHRYLHAKGLPANRWRTEAIRRFEKELQAACHLHSDPLA